MTNFTSNTYTLKREILTFSNKISKLQSKPDRKFTADMTYGMLASGSCLLTDIVDQLHEDSKKVNSVERLTRHLNKGMTDTALQSYLNTIRKWVPATQLRNQRKGKIKTPLFYRGKKHNAYLSQLQVKADTCDDFDYWENSTGITITGYTGDGGDVVIPSEIDGETVTKIGYEAFAYREDLTSIEIPEGVTSIGDTAFMQCSNLKKIFVASSNRYYKSIRGILYTKNGKTLICCPVGKTGKVVIPKGVTKIGKYAFLGSSVSKVTMPNSVTKIEKSAFGSCSNLKSIKLSKNLKEIGQYAFSNCISLKSIVIPAKVTKLGVGAFLYCSNLKNITMTAGKIKKVNNQTFSGIGKATFTIKGKKKDRKILIKKLKKTQGLLPEDEAKPADGWTFK